MNRRHLALAALAGLVLSACTAAGGPGPSDPAASSQTAGAATSSATPVDEPLASLDLPELETDFPPACDIVTADELATIVGNPLAGGTGFTALICDWSSQAEDTSVSLLLQPLPPEFCEDGLPDGEATDRFGGAGSIGYSDSLNIPGAQVGVCVDAGLVLVTVTGGYGAASDEDRYADEAVQVTDLVLARL
ncbi:MAG: hypothetical protein ACRDHD_03035 [Candidatus Limnocylindria bacterium]